MEYKNIMKCIHRLVQQKHILGGEKFVKERWKVCRHIQSIALIPDWDWD